MASSQSKIPAVDAQARQELLNAVLASRQFAHAHTLKRILRFLCDECSDPSAPGPKEYEIAVGAMGRPDTFDPRLDPVVRVSIGHVRERLDAYFATEGSHQPLRLLLPRGQYRVEFRPVEVKPTPAAGPAPVEFSSTRHFWQPYLAAGAPNVIGYTEPLFFHNSSGLYVRDWFSNQPDAPTETLRRLPNWEDYRPSYHYLSSGEMHCLLSLTRMFQEMRVGVETRNVRLSSWKELRDSNLVLLGCARTNPFLVSVEGESAFRVCERWIENVSPQAGEQERYEGRRFQDGKLVRLIEYAVITRRPGFSPERAITLLASNHGRGIEAIGHMLTLEDRTRDLLEWAGFAAARPLPRHFQVLVRVEAVDIDDEIMHVEPVARRILAE